MTLQIQIYTTSHRFILIMLLEATIVSSLDYGSNFWAPIVMPPTVAKPEQLFLFISKIDPREVLSLKGPGAQEEKGIKTWVNKGNHETSIVIKFSQKNTSLYPWDIFSHCAKC